MKLIFVFLVSLISISKSSAQTIFASPCVQVGTTSFNIFCNTAATAFPTRSTAGTVTTPITILTLTNQGFTSIPTGSFTGLNIDQLVMSTNTLQTIAADTFTGATSIRTIGIIDTTFNTIATGGLTPLASSLQELSIITSTLSDANMDTIKTGLTGLGSFTKLVLNTNDLTTIAADWLSGLTTLAELQANNNKMTTLASTAFSSNTALKKIDLSNNMFTDFSVIITAMTPLASVLEELKMTDNQLTTIPTIGTAFSALKILDLSTNNIASVAETTSLNNFPALTQLTLTGNRLTVVPGISQQSSLITIQMNNQNSQLMTLADNSFSRDAVPLVPTNINLDTNTIGTFSTKAFCSGSTPNFGQIDITYDSIGNFNKCLFKQMKAANAALTTTLNVVNTNNVVDVSSFCNCANKVFATNNQVSITALGACSTFTDACTTTTYTDDCSTDYTCPRASSGIKIQFGYFGFVLTNLVFFLSFKQF